MMPQAHALISAALGGGVWILTQDTPAAVGALLAGTLIDVDHLLDAWIAAKDSGWNLKGFPRKFNERRLCLQIMHSWEMLFGLLVLTILDFSSSTLLVGVTLSLTIHLLIDQFHWRVHPMFYFLWWRLSVKFERQASIGYTIPEAAEKTGVSEDDLLRQISRGKLKANWIETSCFIPARSLSRIS